MENVHEAYIRVAVVNIFRRAGKSAIIAQKSQRVACYQLHMKPRHYSTECFHTRTMVARHVEQHIARRV